MKKWQGKLRIVFALAGVVAIGLLVRTVGWEKLLAEVWRAAAWLPLAFTFALVRVGLDAWATRVALASAGPRVPVGQLLRAQLIGTAVSNIAPAGRTTEEATKATLLSRWVSAGEAAQAAFTNQASTLIAGGLVSLPCAWAFYATGAPPVLTVALLLHAAVLVAAGLGLRALMRRRSTGRWLRGPLRRLRSYLPEFQEKAREEGVFPVRVVLLLCLERLAELSVLTVLALAVRVDVTPAVALRLEGLQLLSLVGGIVVPGQVGVSEGLFVSAAGTIPASHLQGISIALLYRLTTLSLALVGSLAPLVWRAPPAEA